MCRAGAIPSAGFVLAGGRSRRMGTDKALLSIGGQTLLEQTAQHVLEAVGDITVIADPAKYARFGFPVVADCRSECGPLGGVITALSVTGHPWNLIVACDMPGAVPAFLRMLVEAASSAGVSTECVAPLGPTGPEPLCAVYHRRALVKLTEAADRGILTMRRVLDSLEMQYIPADDAQFLRNINTPEDWAAHV